MIRQLRHKIPYLIKCAGNATKRRGRNKKLFKLPQPIVYWWNTRAIIVNFQLLMSFSVQCSPRPLKLYYPVYRTTYALTKQTLLQVHVLLWMDSIILLLCNRNKNQSSCWEVKYCNTGNSDRDDSTCYKSFLLEK